MKRLAAVLVLLNVLCLGFVAWQRAGQSVVATPAVTSGPAVPAVVAPPSRRLDHEVVMYGASWCGYCAKARRYFADNGIRYTEHDVETSDEGRRGFAELGGGGIPVIVIDGTVLRGYDAGALDALLSR